MIYISTGGERKQSAAETASKLLSHSISSIELSGGKYEKEHLNKLIKLKSRSSFLVHNYFPPPKEPFVFNLGSLNNGVAEKSVSHAKKAIDYAVALNSPTYSFHAGFLMDPKVSELGKKIKPKKLYSKKESMKVFIDNVNYLSQYAKDRKVDLLIENNVLSNNNKNLFDTNPLLMTDIADSIEIMSETPTNVNLLIDLAHLKVSATSLSFDKKEFLKKTDKWIKGYHLSDNNGLSDTNSNIEENSWFWDYINKDIEFFTIEVYGLAIDEILQQIELVDSKI